MHKSIMLSDPGIIVNISENKFTKSKNIIRIKGVNEYLEVPRKEKINILLKLIKINYIVLLNVLLERIQLLSVKKSLKMNYITFNVPDTTAHLNTGRQYTSNIHCVMF